MALGKTGEEIMADVHAQFAQTALAAMVEAVISMAENNLSADEMRAFVVLLKTRISFLEAHPNEPYLFTNTNGKGASH